MSDEDRRLSSDACDKLADSYMYLGYMFDSPTQKLYDTFANACLFADTIRSCFYLKEFARIDQEDPTGAKLRIKPNLDDIMKNKFNFFKKRCDQKDPHACIQAVEYLTLNSSSKSAFEYAEKACSLNNSNGCEWIAMDAIFNGNEKKAEQYLTKACEMGRGSICYALFYNYSVTENVPKGQKIGEKTKKYAEKTIESGYCHPLLLNPHSVLAMTTDDEKKANSLIIQGCQECDDSLACIENAGMAEDKGDIKESQRLLYKACRNVNFLIRPELLEPCFEVFPGIMKSYGVKTNNGE